jgi:23S rRNA pseudouridine1911/1915/1917 synthase
VSGTLVNALLFHASTAGRDEPLWQPRLVQRLDKGTSGLLVVAKSAETHAALQDDAAAFTKEYLALVWGRPVPSAGRIAVRLGRDPLDRRRVMAAESGAAAVTEYRTIARARGAARGISLLCCRLVTGRTHQLRVHLAERGWPLVGEPTYGHRPSGRLDDPTVDRAVRAFSRQALHAWRLRFRHPRSGQQMAFAAPPADDMGRLLRIAGLSGWS